MRLVPRHYIFIAAIVGLGIYNFVRLHRTRPSPPAARVAVAPMLPRPESPAWSSFDAAAGVRDAPDASFQPKLHDLQSSLAAAQGSPSISDLEGCKTWLLFYRQGVLHPPLDKDWLTRSTSHLNSCVAHHQDLAS